MYSIDKHSLPYLKKKVRRLCSETSAVTQREGRKKNNPSNASMCISELISTKVKSFEPAQHSFFLQIGGTEEYKICRGIKEGRITKPVVCWCIGTCATMFSSEVCAKMGANARNKYISMTGKSQLLPLCLKLPELSVAT